MKTKTIAIGFIAALALGSIALAPVIASAQDKDNHGSQRNGPNHDWVRAGNGSFDAKYTADEMKHDRHSHDEGDMARARIYSKKSFMHNGQRYHRHTRKENGIVSFYFSL